MTDDKGTGEGPYKIMLNDGRITAVSGPNGCWGRLEGEDLVMVLNDAHAAGRKAEREWCLSIVQAVMCVEDDLLNDIGKGIVETIKIGGQDGK